MGRGGWWVSETFILSKTSIGRRSLLDCGEVDRMNGMLRPDANARLPASRANFAPLMPLFSNSSNSASRRSAGTRTRPRVSVFRTSTSPMRDVIGAHALTSMTLDATGAPADAYA